MFKNRHVEVKLVEDQKSDWTHTPVPPRQIQINVTEVGDAVKKTVVAAGVVAAGYKVLSTACRIAEIYANK